MLPSTSSPAPAESVGPVATMQGTLWKWTNYLSGWQPRWFVLEGGSLAYFLSPNEVHLGSRGSLKVSSCDILVHPSDNQRMDMVMPGGRHIYLRAASMTERQQWLLALGVAKQGRLDLDSGNVSRGTDLQKKMKDLQNHCQLLVSQIASIQTMTSDPTTLNSEVLSGLSSDVTRTCDQFLSSLQECMELSISAHPQPLGHVLKPLPLKELYAPKKGGGLSPVSKLSGFSESDLYPPPVPPSTPASATSSLPLATQLATKHQRKTTPTTGIATPTLGRSLPSHLLKSGGDNDDNHAGDSRASDGHAGDSRASDDGAGAVHVAAADPKTEAVTIGDISMDVRAQDSRTVQTNSRLSGSHSASDVFITPTSSPRLTPPSSPSPAPSHSRPSRIGDRVVVQRSGPARRHETFFSSLSVKFEDLELQEVEQIPTLEFLQCCEAVLPFFDILSSTAFAPVKADINGNIKKLSAKFSEDPERFYSLQSMVNSELRQGTQQAKNSSTDALLWLKRAMEFVQQFIAEVAGGEHSLDVAAGKAYGVSLRRYHSWIVRGVFNLAMKAVPYHKDFLRVLGSLGTDEGERQVTADMALFAASLGEIVLLLNQFYHKHNLDPLPAQ